MSSGTSCPSSRKMCSRSPERDDNGSEASVVEESDVVFSEFELVMVCCIRTTEEGYPGRAAPSPFSMVHASPDAALSHLLESLPSRPFQKDELDKLVSKVLQDAPSKSSLDVRRGQWELALKNEILTLAVRAGRLITPHNFA